MVRIAVITSVILALAALVGCGGEDPQPVAPAAPKAEVSTPAVVPAADHHAEHSFVGRSTCAQCHADEVAAFADSHHDLAMQPVNAETVLGDFNAEPFTDAAGITTTFRQDGDNFFMTTADHAGEIREFQVAYVFGVTPLQQYLVDYGKGRFQTLPICWDSRPKEDGGQNWFHLYGDDPVPPGDVIHWTGALQNWNRQCAECHSTNLEKNYDASTDTYHTSWHEIDVSCEACHGPASGHLDWIEAGADTTVAGRGFSKSILGGARTDWVFGEHMVAAPDTPRTNDRQVETCARCHSRRSQILENVHGEHLAGGHIHAPLLPPLWYADGQILDEDYVYGSFVQSKMYHAGVTCSDCHEPHSSRLYTEPNNLCARCHVPEHFDTPQHHHHAAGSAGASCVDCHMPTTTYMQVDPRRDHSFSIPRPDLSVSIGTPNACIKCHTDKDDTWAATAAEQWWGKPDYDDEVTLAIHAGHTGAADALQRLRQALTKLDTTPIRRAALLQMSLQIDPNPPLARIRAAAKDQDPLVRQALAIALRSVRQINPVPIISPLLDDPERAVRIAAARCLVGHDIPESRQAAFDAAQKLSEESYLFTADDAASRMNHALTYQAQGNFEAAQNELKIATEMEPRIPQVWVNRADLARMLGDETAVAHILEEGLSYNPDSAYLLHSRGLALVRAGQLKAAIADLKRSTELMPDEPRFILVYALSFDAMGNRAQALRLLGEAEQRFPNNLEIHQTLQQLSAPSP